jgi:PAS domain
MQGIQHINPARHDLIDPLLQRLYDYWDEKRRARAMPSRADIDPLEMAFILGYVSLVDVLYAPLRFGIPRARHRIGVPTRLRPDWEDARRAPDPRVSHYGATELCHNGAPRLTAGGSHVPARTRPPRRDAFCSCCRT